MSHGNILVVDDDEIVRRSLTECLREEFYGEVDVARDGAEALHQIGRKCYAVVVLDVLMPHMSGVDFLSSIEALTSDPSVKALENAPAIVVMTSMPEEDVRELQQRFHSFVRSVLRKPLDLAALKQTIAEIVG